MASLDRIVSLDNPEAVLDHLVRLLVGRPLPAEQRARLLATLAPEGTTFDPRSRQTLQRIVDCMVLITSLPEYQLS